MKGADDLVALRETLLAQGVAEAGQPDSTLRGAAVRASRPSHLPVARIAPARHSPGADPNGSSSNSNDPSDSGHVDFRVKGTLGEGGMGIVLLAEQAIPRRDVAIKRLKRHDPLLVDALLREATLTGRLEHPSIVPVHAVVSDDEGPAVVMKRIAGEDWSATAQRGVALDRHLEIFVQVCNAVAFAHAQGVVHRDIKLENVRIGDFGEVYLLDWGVAHVLSPSGVADDDRVVGTPIHMAPEMTFGVADVRSDVFLLGATLHEAVTGRPRHDATRMMAVFGLARRAEPYDYGRTVPGELASILNRACARDPDERFESALAFRDAVLRFREHRIAARLAATGSERLAELERLVRERGDYASAQRCFTEARFAFEQARAAWPEGEAALLGLERTLRAMARFELDERHPDAALACLDAMREAPEELRDEAEAVRAALAAEKARLEQLEMDQDPAVGARERRRATAALASAVLLLTGGFVALRLVYPSYATAQLRFAIVGTAVFLVAVAVARRWRGRGEWNQVNRRIVQIATLTLGVSALNRYTALITDAAPPQILLTDALLLGMGGAALTPFHRGGPPLAVMAFVLAFVGAWRPAWLEPAFIGFAVLVPIVFWVTGRMARARSRAAK